MKKTSLLVSCLLSPVLSGLASPAASCEAELESSLPGIIAKAAAHYKALDAAATPLMLDEKGGQRMPHGWNKWKTGRDELDMRSVLWWTAGHFPGSLWYLYEATGDDFFKDRATAWMETLAPNAKVTSNHDVGFIMYCSYGNARRILKTEKYDGLLVETANSLATRYSEKLGLIRSWGKSDDQSNFLVIPDNLMNLELLEFAAAKDGRFAKIAESHADVTMKNHFRADGGCYHVLDYDQREGFAGTVQEIRRGQGASCETAWSRGQSWGIYGYTMMYRTSGYVRYLDFAKKLADYAMNHPNMPADGIPFWDYGAPGEERDSSAGAIMASALLELSQYVGAADRDRYRAFAVKQLLALASSVYFSEGNEIGHWLLKHGTGNKPRGGEVDTPLDYGDYYFLEALLRFRNLRARERAIAGRPGLSALPEKAALPADEIAWRCRTENVTNLVKFVRKAIAGPIPDTTDELYGEYWTTGNRTHYQKRFFQRLSNLDALAELLSGAVPPHAVLKGKRPSDAEVLARIEDYIAAICDMKSWVLPAHDSADGGKGTFRGVWISTDLFSTEVAAHLACVVQSLGDRLKPATVARIKAEVERRVFGPLRREALASCFPGTSPEGLRVSCLWWLCGRNNWAAVCWDNAVCAAMGLVDDKTDRAFFVRGADICMDRYLDKGFEADGYCSEGMGYWNYGYGHYLTMGRMLDLLTDGKLDLLHRAKADLASAYARAYTLAPGVSPLFADGGGAVNPKFLALVDAYWPDLPKDVPPASEFPDGQVWLLRDPQGLSVAFKGGHNAENHNHNDLGSYYVLDGGAYVAGDPGGEVYTARTFTSRRYESQVINSYAHPVPVVGGQLQKQGRARAAKILCRKVDGREVERIGDGGERVEVTLDLTAGYPVKALKILTRTFVYDRAAKAFTVTDRAEFSEPTAFEDCCVTLEGKNAKRGDPVAAAAPCRCTAEGLCGAEAVRARAGDALVDNPDRKTPHRFAWTFEKPVTSATVTFEFQSKNSHQERKN